jgi:hypothetical protein
MSARRTGHDITDSGLMQNAVDGKPDRFSGSPDQHDIRLWKRDCIFELVDMWTSNDFNPDLSSAFDGIGFDGSFLQFPKENGLNIPELRRWIRRQFHCSCQNAVSD